MLFVRGAFCCVLFLFVCSNLNLYILILGSVGCKWKCFGYLSSLLFTLFFFFFFFFFLFSPFLLVMKKVSEVLDSECTSYSDSFVFVFAKRDGQSRTFSG